MSQSDLKQKDKLSFFSETSIRYKLIMSGFFSALLCMGVIFVLSDVVLSNGFLKIEQEFALKDLNRVSDTLSNQVSQLNSRLSDWAAWDDTYRFVQDFNKNYLESNLTNDSIANANVNIMLFADTTGKVLHASGVNIEDLSDYDISDFLDHLKTHPDGIVGKNIVGSVKGIILLPDGPLMVASQPIVMSDKSGVINARLVFGRFIDDTIISEVKNLTHINSLDLYEYNSSSLPSDVVSVKKSFTNHISKTITVSSDSTMTAYQVIEGMQGEPILILRIETNRPISAIGRFTVNFFIAIIFVTLILVNTILFFVVNKLIFSRFFRLHKEVVDIGSSYNLSKRVTESDKNDEISALAGTINRTLEALDSAQKQERVYIEKIKSSDEELRKKLSEIEKMNSFMIDREIKMTELKKENAMLKKQNKSNV